MMLLNLLFYVIGTLTLVSKKMREGDGTIEYVTDFDQEKRTFNKSTLLE